jgi:hypothetical protein
VDEKPLGVVAPVIRLLTFRLSHEEFLQLDRRHLAFGLGVTLWFLLIVATWRISLLLFFLRRVAQLPVMLGIMSSVLPLALIIFGLALANLEHAVFTIMAGNPLNPAPGTPADDAYAIVVLLAMLSFISSPVLLFAYLIAIITRREDAKKARSAKK